MIEGHMGFVVALQSLEHTALYEVAQCIVGLQLQQGLAGRKGFIGPAQLVENLDFAPVDRQPVGPDRQPLLRHQQALLQITEHLQGQSQAGVGPGLIGLALDCCLV